MRWVGIPHCTSRPQKANHSRWRPQTKPSQWFTHQKKKLTIINHQANIEQHSPVINHHKQASIQLFITHLPNLLPSFSYKRPRVPLPSAWARWVSPRPCHPGARRTRCHWSRWHPRTTRNLRCFIPMAILGLVFMADIEIDDLYINLGWFIFIDIHIFIFISTSIYQFNRCWIMLIGMGWYRLNSQRLIVDIGQIASCWLGVEPPPDL